MRQEQVRLQEVEDCDIDNITYNAYISSRNSVRLIIMNASHDEIILNKQSHYTIIIVTKVPSERSLTVTLKLLFTSQVLMLVMYRG